MVPIGIDRKPLTSKK